MRLRKVLFQAAGALGILLLCGGGARAGEPLTLGAAWRTALKNSLALQEWAASQQRAREEVAIQKAGYLPDLSAVGSYGYTSEVARLTLPFPATGGGPTNIEVGTYSRYDLGLAVQQPLFTGFRTKNLVAAARKQVGAEDARKSMLRDGIRLQVGQIYYRMQLNRMQRRVLAQAIARAGTHLEQVRSLFSAAQSTAFDTLEVANRRLQLEGQVQTLQHQYGILASQLARALNLTSVPQVAAVRVDSVAMRLDPLSTCIDRALKHRPEVARFDSLVQAQKYRVAAQKSAMLPQVYADAGLHYGRPGVDAFRDRWMGYYTVGVNVRWRFWDWDQDRRRVKQARLDVSRISLEQKQAVLDIRQAVTDAYRQLQTVRDQIEVQRRLVAQERERYRITKAHFESGYATSLDLSESEKTLTAAEITLQEQSVEWMLYELQLRFSMGTIGSRNSGG